MDSDDSNFNVDDQKKKVDRGNSITEKIISGNYQK